MLQYSNRVKPVTVRKRWYNTQTVPKSVTSQKKMVQYSNRTKTCHQSERDGSILKQNQNLSRVRKRWYNTQTVPKPVTSQKKDGTILKQCQNLSPVRKRWYNTQTEPKPVTSQKKMVQFLNSQNTLTELCSQTGQNLLPVRRPNNTQTEQKVRKRWYNTQTVPKEPKPATSQKNMVQYSNTAKTCQQSEKDATVLKQSKTCHSQKKMVQHSNSAKICHQSEKDGTILKQNQNLSPVGKRWYNTQTVPKPVTSQKKMVQYSNRTKTCHQSERDGTILKQSEYSNRVVFSNRPKLATSEETKQYSNRAKSQKKMVQYSNSTERAKTCHQSEKYGTILKHSQNLSTEKDATVLKQSKTCHRQKKMVQYLNSAKIYHQ